MKTLVALLIGLLVVTAGHTAILDNSGPPVKKRELTDAEKERQMVGPSIIPGGAVPNQPRKNAPGVSSDDEQRNALLSALEGKGGDPDAQAALKKAADDVAGERSSGWLKNTILGAAFAILGFGVVLALRRWTDRVLPPPAYPNRRKR